MSEPSKAESPAAAPVSSGEDQSTLFAHLVMQQANLALVMIGKVADPSHGPVKDLDAARLFIDQLQMLEAKTKGNLSSEEAALLKQTLMTVQMAFVEAVESEASPKQPQAPSPSKPSASAEAPAAPETEPTAAASEPEHRPKFSKKY